MSAQADPPAGMVRCPKCHGSSKVNVPVILRRGDGEADVYVPVDCPPCGGKGYVVAHRVCQKCGKFKSCCGCAGNRG